MLLRSSHHSRIAQIIDVCTAFMSFIAAYYLSLFLYNIAPSHFPPKVEIKDSYYAFIIILSFIYKILLVLLTFFNQESTLNIVWVENNSQDFVFCNYVLSKETIDIEDAIKELNRILKSGWKVIYSDYEKDEKLLMEFKKYFKVEIIYDEKDWIIIICTK